MSRVYLLGATRMYNDDLLDSWIEAEENMGLDNSLFFWKNGTTEQWIDSEEAEEFFKKVKEMDFDKVFDDYFKAIEKKDKIKIFECLAVFNELDEHPEIASIEINRRLKRVRESSHEVIYKLDSKLIKI